MLSSLPVPRTNNSQGHLMAPLLINGENQLCSSQWHTSVNDRKNILKTRNVFMFVVLKNEMKKKMPIGENENTSAMYFPYTFNTCKLAHLCFQKSSFYFPKTILLKTTTTTLFCFQEVAPHLILHTVVPMMLLLTKTIKMYIK